MYQEPLQSEILYWKMHEYKIIRFVVIPIRITK